MDADRMAGAVKWFSRVKGYGFIAPDGQEKEIFVHFSGIEGEGYRNLHEGERVSFLVEQTPRGPQAVQVRVEGDSPSEADHEADHEAGHEAGLEEEGGEEGGEEGQDPPMEPSA